MPSEIRHAAGFVLFKRHPEGLRFLLLENARHGTWGFPKGHRESGENDIDCARRELEEETGLRSIRILEGFERELEHRVEHKKKPRRKITHYFLAEWREGQTELSAEHQSYLWADLEAGRATLQFDALRELLSEASTFVESRDDGKRV